MGNKYSEEFMRDAVKTVSEGGLTVTAAARKIGVNYEALREWCRQSKLEKSYATFIHRYKRHIKKERFISFHDYLTFLEDSGVTHTTPYNASSYMKYFEFASKSESTILDDCLSLIRKSAEAGYFVAGDADYTISLHCSDSREYWLEGYEDEFEKGKIHFIEDDNPNSGAYKIISQKEFIDFYSFSLEDFNWKYLDLHICNEQDAYMSDKFKSVFLQDINKILPNFMVAVCSETTYELQDGGGRSYYLVFGYNPKTKQGEGLFIEDVCL